MNQRATAIGAIRNGKRQNRSATTPGQDRRELHRQPARLDPDVEIAVVAGLGVGPPAERILDAIDEQRRHGHRDRDQEAARDAEIALPEMPAGHGEQHRVDDRDQREHAAAELREGERGEQAHGADDDERARVPEHVDQIETRPQALGRGAEELPERLGLGGVEHAGGDRLLEIAAAQDSGCGTGRCVRHECLSPRHRARKPATLAIEA